MKEYSGSHLTQEDLLSDPIEQFRLWFNEAQAKGEIEPSAMTLATVTPQYEVTARMVLLKFFDNNGFAFFTNYTSPKALALTQVPHAALVFWWPTCQHQVRITGSVELLDTKSSDNYFNQRSKESRIAAIVSKQSKVIANREDLMRPFEKLSQEYATQTILPRPDYWGGFILKPARIEFWQAQTHRLHDRFEYRKQDNGWHIVRLSP